MKTILTAIFSLALFVPSVSFASTLTPPQVNAIVALLYAFGVDQATIGVVRLQLAPSVTTPQPTFGSIETTPSVPVTQAPVQSVPIIPSVKVMPIDQSKVTAEVINHLEADVKGGQPFGTYTIRARVLSPDGKPNGGTFVTNPRDEHATKIPIVMTSPNNAYGLIKEAIIDTNETTSSKDYYHDFSYAPTQSRSVTLTFTSGNLSTDLSLVVE